MYKKLNILLILLCAWCSVGLADVGVYCPDTFEYVGEWNEKDEIIMDKCPSDGAWLNGFKYFASKYGVHMNIVYPVTTIYTRIDGKFQWYPYTEQDIKNLLRIDF